MARDIIVVGASAGGIAAVETLVQTLPRDLPAAMFVAIHVSPWAPSILPEILNRNGTLQAIQGADGLQIEHGHIYVAPPDFHLILDDAHMKLWRGPKEGLHRPAINALFRSAATAFGPRVIGVVMSGMLDDGSAGLWWIKQYGGIAIVQEPKTAAFPDMPQNALSYVDADYVLPPGKIGPVLAELTNSHRGKYGDRKA